tara:strand:- start:1646 stop:2101 length:456 start_codon:yes stop_codon:yes gene_type:complete
MSKWLFFPTPTSSETVKDTYTQSAQWIWRSANNWWNNIDEGTWSSTGTTTGTYLKLDSGSRIVTDKVVFSADDPNQGGLGADWEIRVTISPSTGGVKTTLRGTNAGAGDSIWNWVDAGGSTTTLSSADIEDGGNFGWDNSDTIKIELVDPS